MALTPITLKLSHKIPIYHYQAKMSVGIQEKHEEIVAVLLLAQELGQISPKDIAEKLLIGFPITGAEILLNYIQNLDLIDKVGKLTKPGIEVITSIEKLIQIPEDDVYDIYCIYDPLVSQIILDFEPLERKKNSYDVLNDSKKATHFDPLPDWLKNIKGHRILKKINGNKSSIEIFDIAPIGKYERNNKPNSIVANIVINQNDEKTLQFSKNYQLQTNIPSEFNFQLCWNKVLNKSNLINDWVYIPELGKNVLKINFRNQSSELDLKNFQISLPNLDIDIDNFGNFNCGKIGNIPVFPKSPEDAQKWLEELVYQDIGKYFFLEEIQQITDQIKKSFGQYSTDLVTLPIDQLKNRINESEKQKIQSNGGIHQKKYWYIHTPIDLPLE